jgi:RNA-directed DNA polymerase
MDGKQSYEVIVPEKVGNRRASKWQPRYPLEGRTEQGYASFEGNMSIHRNREVMSPGLNRISELAREDPERQFISIAHFLTPKALHGAFLSLRKEAAEGVDGVTYGEYAQGAEEKIRDLHDRLRKNRYRAQPLRRVYIPKEGGRRRPISIPALEDKIVQRATVDLLNAIYEQDFLDFSFGGRPGRGAQDALDEIGTVICRHGTSYVLEADVTAYLETSSYYTSFHERFSKRLG